MNRYNSMRINGTNAGYYITVFENGRKFPLYIQSYYKGVYTFTTDHAHAKHYKSLKTAQQHVKRIWTRGDLNK